MSMRKQIGDYTDTQLNDYLVFRDAEICKGVTDNPTWLQVIPNNSTDMTLDGGMMRDFYIRTGDMWMGSTLGDRTPYFTGQIYCDLGTAATPIVEAEIYAIFRDIRIFVNGVQLNNNLSASWDKVMATMIRDREPNWIRAQGPNLGIAGSQFDAPTSTDLGLQFSSYPFGVGCTPVPGPTVAAAIPFIYPIPAGYSLLGNREHPIPVPFLQELRVQVVANQSNRMSWTNNGTAGSPSIKLTNLQLWVPAFEVKEDVNSIFRDKLIRADAAAGIEDMLVYLVNDIQVTTQSLANLTASPFLNVPFNIVTTSANCVEVVVESTVARTDPNSSFKTLVSPHISCSQYRMFFDGKAVDQYPILCAPGTASGSGGTAGSGRYWVGGDSRGWETYLDYVTTKNELYGYETDSVPSNSKILFDSSQYTSSNTNDANGYIAAIQATTLQANSGGWAYDTTVNAVNYQRYSCPCTPRTVGGLFVMCSLFSTDRNLLTTRPYSQANLQMQISYTANSFGGYGAEVRTAGPPISYAQTPFGVNGFTLYMITHSHQFIYLSRSRCYVVS